MRTELFENASFISSCYCPNDCLLNITFKRLYDDKGHRFNVMIKNVSIQLRQHRPIVHRRCRQLGAVQSQWNHDRRYCLKVCCLILKVTFS